MTDSGNNTLELTSTISFFYDNVKKKNPNYFELLGIPTNATQKDIEGAYFKYASEFNSDKFAGITDPDVKKKADYLVILGQRAYEVLSNFEKRGEYERKGFREIDPADIKEDEPEDIAKNYYRKAKTLFTIKNYDMGAKAMQEAIKLDNRKADYYLLLGRCQAKVPEMKRSAELTFQKASQMEQWNVEPIVELGLLFLSERLNNRAETYFRKALEIQNDHPVAKKKLFELVGTEKKGMENLQKSVQDGFKKGLGKVFPSIFGKKK